MPRPPMQADMINIRPAVPADTPLILALVNELAEYEKLLQDVKATQAQLREALFGPSPKVFCAIAEIGEKSAGFALWYYSFSTFQGLHGIYLEDLIVLEPFRGRGIGKALLKHLARRCIDEQLGRLEWSVQDWNIPSIDFYKSQGAVLVGDWTRARISEAALVHLASKAD